ncbi:MAG TPA: acyltransferase [Rhizomicrobium sp.]|nr:acyltransferase [Rhizomicrobium sp.]
MGDRKYFLDWLRVAAFGFLIVFHVGMLYVTYPYNLKSPRLLPEIEPWLTALGGFRLPLLFFISGVAARFLIARLGSRDFARDRIRRLLPVILFAMFVVIPPQTYVELVARGVWHGDYWTFWTTQYLPARQALVRPLHKTMPTWDHVWFVVYLFFYTLVFALGFAITGRAGTTGRHRIPVALLLTAPAIWLAATNLVIFYMFPDTKALVNDWGSHLKWIGMFATGIYCAGYNAFWETLRRYRFALLTAAVALLAVRCFINDPWWSVFNGLYAWPMICALAGYAAEYLNRPSRTLSHLNEAVLPIYVLHQPILLFAAYYLFPLRLPLPVEASAIAAVTAAGCFLIYETVIRPFGIIRFLFGLKPKSAAAAQSFPSVAPSALPPSR